MLLRESELVLTDLKENCAMKRKAGTKSIEKKQVKAVNKRLSPSRKSSLTKKIKETGNNKSESKGLAAVRKHTARPPNTKDITKRKQAGQALAESEERYRTLFENAIEGIFRSTIDGRVILANPAMLLMLGYDAKTFDEDIVSKCRLSDLCRSP